MGVEIERKWLPDREWVKNAINGICPAEIIQGYLCRKPVIRIRKEDDSYILTYKGEGLLQHKEDNLPLNKEAFEELLPKCSGKIVQKKRYRIPLTAHRSDPQQKDSGLIMEIDEFQKPDADLILLEVEFPDEETANSFTAPDFFGKEVTEDPNYYNSAMSV